MKTETTTSAPKVGSSAIVRRLVYFTMVLHPLNGWLRVGKAYNSRETAKGWLGFVRGAWRGCRVKVLSCPLTWINGKLNAASLRRLDVQFNMDAPDSSPNVKLSDRHE
jgi:hypothetical protein